MCIFLFPIGLIYILVKLNNKSKTSKDEIDVDFGSKKTRDTTYERDYIDNNSSDNKKEIEDALLKSLIDGKIDARNFFNIKGVWNRDKKWSGVYVIKDTWTNEHYVGQSYNIYKRLRQHIAGEGNFWVGIAMKNNHYLVYKFICVKNSQKDEVEAYLINKFDSFKNGFNMTFDGQARVEAIY